MVEYVVDTTNAEVRPGLSDISALWGLPVHERIVRCKDCEHFEMGYTDGVMFDETVCWAWDNGPDYPSYTSPDGFCHRGKRKEGR